MKILITGASGFLGRFLTAYLTQDGHEITGVSSKVADLTQSGTLDQFNDVKFDRVYHLAAWTQAGDFCLRHPGEQWVINQKINTNVLDWWSRCQPQAKLVATGTSCSYAPDMPLSEDNYLLGEPIESLYTYAMTKRMMLVGMKSLRKQYNLNYLYVVPSTLYGAGYHTDGRQLHFIFDLIRKIISGKELGTHVALWGDGYQKRELVLVNDFAKIMTALDSKVSNEVVNIGAGEEYTIREFANSICALVGFDPEKVQYDISKYTGAKSKCLDVSKMKRLVPEIGLTALGDGLKSTVQWFLENKSHFIGEA